MSRCASMRNASLKVGCRRVGAATTLAACTRGRRSWTPRAGAPIDVCVSWLPALRRPVSADMFDRVVVSPNGSMRFTGADAAAWFVEQGL